MEKIDKRKLMDYLRECQMNIAMEMNKKISLIEKNESLPEIISQVISIPGDSLDKAGVLSSLLKDNLKSSFFNEAKFQVLEDKLILLTESTKLEMLLNEIGHIEISFVPSKVSEDNLTTLKEDLDSFKSIWSISFLEIESTNVELNALNKATELGVTMDELEWALKFIKDPEIDKMLDKKDWKSWSCQELEKINMGIFPDILTTKFIYGENMLKTFPYRN